MRRGGRGPGVVLGALVAVAPWIPAGSGSVLRAQAVEEGTQQAAASSLTPGQRRRAEYLLRERVACLGCHALDGEGGAIGPSFDGLAARTTRERALSMVLDPAGTVPGTLMPRQPLARDVARLLVAYLFEGSDGAERPEAVPGASEPAAARPEPGPRERTDGRALYARHCAACHGDRGRGDGWNADALPVQPTAHADARLMSRRPDDTLYDAIATGAYILGGSPRMPAFGGMLEPDQIRALVSYIRTLCGCRQPAWAGGGR